MLLRSLRVASAATFVSLVYPAAVTAALPIVDLGYELYQASEFNPTGQFYNFSNIRYAAAPIGDLRFRAPELPIINRSTVQSGLPDRICPQATPAWQAINDQFVKEYLAGQTNFTPSSFNTSSSSKSSTIDPRTTEDCLFLDVVVPKALFEKAGHGNGAPVLVWIYGGGYVEGWKSQDGSPAGLLARSEADHSGGVIFVSINYRLGAFGWLSGPTFQTDGTSNAGLHDQRFALEWVQRHISKFGGDPSRVTVFGESAGGGSILHQITAYGDSKQALPFHQAILQSPALYPSVSNQQQEDVFKDYLSLLDVETIDEARMQPSSKLWEANSIQVGKAAVGQFVYGPSVDGDFVPDLPGLLLLHGQHAKNLNIMVGHNADEGLLLTSPYVQNDTAFREQILALLPTSRSYPSVINYITDTLYPAKFNGSQDYTNQIARGALLVSEAIIACNTLYIEKAYDNKTYSYLFSVPPALHGYDVPYTFYNDPNPAVESRNVAIALQKYITNFAKFGTPNGQGVPFFSMYGDNATVQSLNVTGITYARDPAANYRCDWWQKGLYQ